MAGSTTQCWRAFTNPSLQPPFAPPPGGDGYNFAPDNYLVTPQTRISFYSIGETKLGRYARGYFEGSYVNRQSQTKLAAEPLLLDQEGINVSGSNFYNPFGRDFNATGAVLQGGVRKRLNEFSNRINTQDIDTIRIVT